MHDSIHNTSHGGDLGEMAKTAGCASHEIIDFSVNIHVQGTPDFIRAALFQAMADIEAYPSPYAKELKSAAAQYHKKHALCAEQFVFGNGSNELIHALSRALKKLDFLKVYIVEPAFSEYALGAQKACLEIERLWLTQEEHGLKTPQHIPDFENNLLSIEANSALFIANPANPSGIFQDPQILLGFIRKRPDLLWIIDEAFIEYVGDEETCSLITNLPENAIILRSLTKFHSVPGVRLGYLITNTKLAQKIQDELPTWNINAFAMSATLAIFDEAREANQKQTYNTINSHNNTQSDTQFAHTARHINNKNRDHLMTLLQNIKGLTALPSSANYILFQLQTPQKTLKNTLLKEFNIAIRDCSNYHGLEDNTWFRVAVRTEEDHILLAHALNAILHAQPECVVLKDNNFSQTPISSSSCKQNLHEDNSIRICTSYGRQNLQKTPALMLQGTSSDAGKSILAAAYCRIFKQDGYDVAPFKAQNMSLNSGVTARGDEMGRAQIVQAQAAGIDPCARMNPVLLKPSSDIGSQVILRGKPIGHMKVKEYFEKKKDIWQTVIDTYDELAKENQIMVLEGAGSPGEINLKNHDIVNMRMARHAQASVLLVGDIDRGGVYASLLGTYMTFNSDERKLLLGYLINKFRGDASLLAPAHTYMLTHTKKPVLGVIPHMHNLGVPDEDMAGFSWTETIDYAEVAHGILDIAVIMLHHVSNYTDIAPLANEPDLRVRAVRHAKEFGNPHVLIIPGSKSVVADLEELHKNGLASKIQKHAEEKKWIFGICGGLQILGRKILDPYAVETEKACVAGLNILDINSQFEQEKTLIHISKAQTPLNVSTKGYEIHHGITTHGKDVLPLFLRDDKEYASFEERICGYVKGKCWATYLHGIFDDNTFRRKWIDHIRMDIGLEAKGEVLSNYDLENSLDKLADTVRAHSNMTYIYQSLGLKK